MRAAQARHLDVMGLVTPAFRKLYTDFYIKLVNKAPALWGYLYHASHDAPKDSSMQRLRRGIERLNTRAHRLSAALIPVGAPLQA
jgi:processive 1,2-diacylglycerol beta-glucosyltransferase